MRTLLSLGLIVVFASQAHAFCGFYVAKADTKLFNKASKVVVARSDNKTVITMANDYKGDPKEFAMVIPVPTFLEREQIHVTENRIIDHLDAYTAPRLVEYFDDDPCQVRIMREMSISDSVAFSMAGSTAEKRAKSLGVTIEAKYAVGEYDILILSAKESDGLQSWLTENDYKIPEGANQVLESYIKQKTRFFVAKVNMKKHASSGRSYLRPLQVAFESKKFMLPIRLGTVNADGDQELFIFMLSQKGRMDVANYRQVKIPTGDDIPVYVKNEFPQFYVDMFDTQVKKEDGRAVFLEYAWDMNWCDPCAADPLPLKDLRELGAFWLTKDKNEPIPLKHRSPITQARDVFVTRLHVRYNSKSFPEDLIFQETSNRENFQGRYVLRHPWKGEASCEEAEEYQKSLPKRLDQEAKTLARLTSWDINEIRKKIKKETGLEVEPSEPKKWYERIWE